MSDFSLFLQSPQRSGPWLLPSNFATLLPSALSSILASFAKLVLFLYLDTDWFQYLVFTYFSNVSLKTCLPFPWRLSCSSLSSMQSSFNYVPQTKHYPIQIICSFVHFPSYIACRGGSQMMIAQNDRIDGSERKPVKETKWLASFSSLFKNTFKELPFLS